MIIPYAWEMNGREIWYLESSEMQGADGEWGEASHFGPDVVGTKVWHPPTAKMRKLRDALQ